MNVQVHFVDSYLLDAGDGKLGTFDMGDVPDVGETVTIKGADYRVESRRWKPGKLVTWVTINVRRS